MACGLPVITSKNAGVAELIHDGMDGFILSRSEDFQALAKLLGRLYADEVLRGNVGAAGAKTALQWTWNRNAADIWELLKNTAAKKLQASSPGS